MDEIRELTETELDEVAGGFGWGIHQGPQVGTGSCWQWVPSQKAWYACNLIDPATRQPYPSAIPSVA